MDTAFVKALAGTLTRGVMWLIAGLLAYLSAKGIQTDAPDASSVEPVIEGILAFALPIIAALWSKRKDAKLLATEPPMIVPCIFLPLLLLPILCGCGGHDFMMEAPAGIVKALNEVDVGIGEYHAAAVSDFDIAQTKQAKGLEDVLAKYIVEVAALGKVATIEQARAALKPELEKYCKQVADLTEERGFEAERYMAILGLTEWGRQLAGQMMGIETARYATVVDL